MISAVSNNTLLAALLGPGVARSSFENSVSGTAQRLGRVEFGRSGPESIEDTVEITRRTSVEARQTKVAVYGGSQQHVTAVDGSSPGRRGQGERGSSEEIAAERLTSEERAEVKELKQRDREVRRHEQAHQAAAGQHALGGASFEFTTGPDGKRYASGGEVSVDTSAVAGNPQATIAKMQQVRRAALAPAEPSSQDRAVAAQAAATERQARSELAQDRDSAANMVGASSDSSGIRGEARAGSTTRTPSIRPRGGAYTSPVGREFEAVAGRRTGGRLDLLA